MATKLERYYSTIPSIYAPGNNKFVTAILQAWAEADESVVAQILETRDQLFIATADREFLNMLGSNVDVNRPQYIALSDAYYRELIVKLSYAPKQIRKTFYDVLDIFWGPTYSRANLICDTLEEYDLGTPAGLTGAITFVKNSAVINGSGTFFTSELNIGDYIKFIGDDNTSFQKIALIVNDEKLYLESAYLGSSKTGDGKFYTAKVLTYKADNDDETSLDLSPIYFVDLAAATADEIANSINSANVKIASSTIRTILSDDKYFVNIRTKTPGTTGSIQITGGTANAILGFDTEKYTIDDLQNSTIIYEITPRQLIIEVPRLIARLERTLKGAWHIHDDITGVILDVDNITKTLLVNLSEEVEEDELVGKIFTQGIYEFVIIGNSAGMNNVTIEFNLGEDLLFIQEDGAQTFTFGAALSVNVPHNLNNSFPNIQIYNEFDDAILPQLITSLDGNNSKVDFTSAQSGSISVLTQNHVFADAGTTWNIAHNLNEQYLNIAIYNSSSEVIMPDEIEVTDADNLVVSFNDAQNGRVGLLIGDVFDFPVAATTWVINHNLGSKYVVTTIYDENDKVIIPDNIHIINKNSCEITFDIAQAGKAVVNAGGQTGNSSLRILNPAYPNSYVYDLNNSFTLTSRRATLNQNISTNDLIVNLIVNDAAGIPNEEGHFIINFGKANQEGPIPYKGRIDNQELIVDPLYIFKNDHLIGDIINYVASTSAYIPRKKGQDYPIYVTGTEEALLEAQKFIEKLKAVGVVLEWVVKKPQYRFEC